MTSLRRAIVLAGAASLVAATGGSRPHSRIPPSRVTALLHVALRATDPRANDTLTTAPTRVRLEFTEAVDAGVSRIVVSGPDSTPVAISPLRAADSTSHTLTADLAGAPLGPGTYQVRWTVTSRDGHTVRGTFAFAVAPPVIDTVQHTPDSAAAAAPASGDETGDLGDAEFDASSPAYAVIRWLTYIGIFGVIGALLFRTFVLRRAASVDRAAEANADPVHDEIRLAWSRARGISIGSAVVLIVATLLRLGAQMRSVLGEMSMDPAMASALLSGTAWGRGWIAGAAAAVVALGAALSASRPSRVAQGMAPADWLLAVVAVMVAVSAALSGHPAAVSPALVGISADAIHVLAASGWIGTLAYVALAGIPAAAAAGERQAEVVRAQVRAFSSIAKICVGVVVATGVVSAWLQLSSVGALWSTPYGETLLYKLALVALVAAAGAYNWRVATPRILREGGMSQIRRVIAIELVLALSVLAATSQLVATSPPVDDMATEAPATP